MPNRELRASDYQQLVMSPEEKRGELRVVTGQFLMLTPDSTFDIPLLVQLGEGAPQLSKAIRIQPGDVIKTETEFRSIYIWHGALGSQQQLKLLISNRPIAFNPSPQVLSQEIKVSDFSLTFDRKIADIAFFSKPYTPINPEAKLWELKHKATPDQNNLATFITQSDTSGRLDGIKDGTYYKNMYYMRWLASESSPREDKLITAEDFPPGSLIILLADLQCNANLMSFITALHRKGNDINSAKPVPYGVGGVNQVIQSRYLQTTNEDTAATNGLFRMLGSDSFSPMPSNVLAQSGLEYLMPFETSGNLSGDFGRSSHSFVFFFNETLGIPALNNSINAFTFGLYLNWIGAFDESTVTNARQSQAMGLLGVTGWIANPAWLKERLGGWYL